ncbi:hypothetical protein BDZ89DRAFT_1056147 [Hymenopellis radicata]|nr:hypothetical protein BDZ89DRAFT_1056147 [Hymenopellis radicata]
MAKKTGNKPQRQEKAPAPPKIDQSAIKNILAKLQFNSKRDLECRVALDDQILVIDNFLSAKECHAVITAADAFPLEMTPAKRRGEADRFNYRFSIDAPEFAERLRALLLPHLPLLPPSRALKKSKDIAPRHPVALNPGIRFYKYATDHYFGPHYDDYVLDEQSGQMSEWTLLIYLTGQEDGVEGGQTIFYKDEKCRPSETIIAPLTRGAALLHRHGPDCMLHEGSKVLAGTKYVLRSDLMFKDV